MSGIALNIAGASQLKGATPHECNAYCSGNMHKSVAHTDDYITRNDILRGFPPRFGVFGVSGPCKIVDAVPAHEVPSSVEWNKMRGITPLFDDSSLKKAWLLTFQALGAVDA